MFSIGDFARHGRVSVRMLRHYDALGLLRPARVDPATGYRSYTAAQLARLNRIVALKDLGFTLEQVATLLADEVTVEQVRGMLTLRRAELEAALAEGAARLARVEARLRTIEAEGRLLADDVVVKELPGMRVVELTAIAAGFAPEAIGPVVHPLCAELGRRLPQADVTPAGRLTCYYEQRAEDEVVVHAAIPASVGGGGLDGLTVADLPATRAATLVHRGPIDDVLPAWQAVVRWIDDHGRRSAGPQREVYLDCPEDPAGWVTELQEPIS
ncbi:MULTISPECIES: MerR family transcriptional regulator [unclassified Amycolatopsis]|uniref:MerR family transcriptional regulator n=1 Tax=unclassified Amycolatopsis TaxID=2618356 RepID=UPI00287595B7|nr:MULTISPECIES: MerR family transcriptional regulator [unclassified Amycolatopsis]MDS0135736.1 MerR family transcriptional regulator [Amycolatopsis sp. 505]MDS0145663.1 MerR family transcriptional regulator [Amycolatopsis sp. CM201R]